MLLLYVAKPPSQASQRGWSLRFETLLLVLAFPFAETTESLATEKTALDPWKKAISGHIVA